MKYTSILPLVTLCLAGPAFATPAEILSAELRQTTKDWTVSVTLAHEDTGWDDYADGWQVELEDGTILGTRVLAHPHVNEQPFTRSLSGVVVPEGTTRVFIRAKTLTEGWGESRLEVAVPDN